MKIESEINSCVKNLDMIISWVDGVHERHLDGVSLINPIEKRALYNAIVAYKEKMLEWKEGMFCLMGEMSIEKIKKDESDIKTPYKKMLREEVDHFIAHIQHLDALIIMFEEL